MNMERYISKEQFYKVAHIRKATALRLIQEGLVPAIDTGKPTNRYKIRWSDVEFYLRDREEHPEKYGLTRHNLTQHFPEKYKKSEAKKLGRYAKMLWREQSPLLSVEQASVLLGYSHRVVLEWTRKKGLQRLMSDGHAYIPKKSLLQFVESRAFHEIRMKSRQHIEMIRSANL